MLDFEFLQVSSQLSSRHQYNCWAW